MISLYHLILMEKKEFTLALNRCRILFGFFWLNRHSLIFIAGTFIVVLVC